MTSTPVPEWLTADLFVSVLEKNVENFEKIISFKANTPFAAGENFLSVLWGIEIEASMKGKFRSEFSSSSAYLQRVNSTENTILYLIYYWL